MDMAHENRKDEKDRLVKRLRKAAELEHQFMCQYLYAALSVKKVPDATCKPYQVEMARRWASTLYMVARQEMEHLALANNLLRSIGAPPYFYRANIGEIDQMEKSSLAAFHLGAAPSEVSAAPSKTPGPCDRLIPLKQIYAFDPFNLCTIQRFACMESPNCETLLTTEGDPYPDWCFEEKKAAAVARSRQDVQPGTVQALYEKIEADFKKLPADAFVSKADEQVEIIQQYDIFVFPVTDHASAQQAIDLIAEQGEGINTSPTYQSHYRRFMDIRKAYYDELFPNGGEAGDPCKSGKYDPNTAGFQPGYPLRRNPKGDDITDEYTREVFSLFNQSYGSLLVMLTGLYATLNQKPTAYPYFAAALGQEAFAPFMTMIVRTLGEILVQLKAGDDQHGGFAVGPNFQLPADLQAALKHPYQEDGTLKPLFGDIECLLERTADFATRLETLVNKGNPPTLNPEVSPGIQTRMEYMLENAQRITVNLRRIYQQGIYKALDAGTF